ncbi:MULTISPECIES: hypothetical protein [Pseudomonas]|uniref:hypothetical protein n=1 Tax=Pseudomonas TaxID=286 RepID=UPI00087A2209|nr:MULTISPECIES: hypothetical protein [Pseudomonas]AZD95305.1 hypothetical protein C4K13_5933 [Pseudomonas chlororaphis subsp. aureofaciens]KAB0523090.1 hypothetical protein F7R16_32135 [Pseudomonas chlororaphis subsp. aureofaciens]TSD29354.1 hypothetical protein FCE86_007200 [Pseudomonas sp. ATCC 13985]WDG47816.1 hypothetical protein PUP58_29500 [Pseudomonas chlororaphis]WDG59967.1 hypothetical protein PUP52_29895 [Pseudomonas chlororaphis]
MQVQVITGEMATGKTTRLRAIQAELERQGLPAEIHVGANCTTPYFVNLVRDQAMAGAKHFLADDCTQFQIKAVMELKSQGLHSGIPSDFVLHLVRQA